MPTAETPAAGGEGLAAETAMRLAIHAWIREDVPLAGKMNLYPKHVDALIARLAALRGPAPGDGSGEAMREACACWHDDQAAQHYAGARALPLDSPDRAYTAAIGAEHEASATAIRALPIPAGRGAGGGRT